LELYYNHLMSFKHHLHQDPCVRNTHFFPWNNKQTSDLDYGATISHKELLLRSVKYIITTYYLALQLKPNSMTIFGYRGSNRSGSEELEGIFDIEHGAG
jgi:hypothetical protein